MVSVQGGTRKQAAENYSLVFTFIYLAWRKREQVILLFDLALKLNFELGYVYCHLLFLLNTVHAGQCCMLLHCFCTLLFGIEMNKQSISIVYISVVRVIQRDCLILAE